MQYVGRDGDKLVVMYLEVLIVVLKGEFFRSEFRKIKYVLDGSFKSFLRYYIKLYKNNIIFQNNSFKDGLERVFGNF